MRFLPVVLLTIVSAYADIYHDRVPSMRWEEMVSAKRVVVARYVTHEGNTLQISVDECLKGTDSPGDILTIALEHLWSVQTRRCPVGVIDWSNSVFSRWHRGLEKRPISAQLLTPSHLNTWLP